MIEVPTSNSKFENFCRKKLSTEFKVTHGHHETLT